METKVSTNQTINVSVKDAKKTPTKRVKLKESDEKPFVKLRIEKFGTKLDLLTGEKFVPKRRNQKFANSKNRMKYHNDLNNQKNFEIISEFKNVKHIDEQNSNWQDVLFCLNSLSGQSSSDKISFLMNKYSITKNEKVKQNSKDTLWMSIKKVFKK
jgi:hypothetical protein